MFIWYDHLLLLLLMLCTCFQGLPIGGNNLLWKEVEVHEMEKMAFRFFTLFQNNNGKMEKQESGGISKRSSLQLDRRWATDEVPWLKNVWLAGLKQIGPFQVQFFHLWWYTLVFQGFPLDSLSTRNWIERALYSLFFFNVQQLLKGIINPLAVKSTPHTGSSSQKRVCYSLWCS